jgi:hypothetical protein
MPDLTPIITLFAQLDPRGVAAVALFVGFCALVAYLTRNEPYQPSNWWFFFNDSDSDC